MIRAVTRSARVGDTIAWMKGSGLGGRETGDCDVVSAIPGWPAASYGAGRMGCVKAMVPP
jgi:hypothetical protein